MVSESFDDLNSTGDYPGKDRSLGRDFSSYKKSRNRLFKISEETPFGLIAAVIFSLVVLFILLFSPDHEKKIDIERVRAIETRLTRLEETFNKYQGTIERIFRLESTMGKKEGLEKRLSKVEGSLSLKRKYHTVQKGETIYSICRKYGLEKKELRRLNKLSTEATIHPGQRLIITP